MKRKRAIIILICMCIVCIFAGMLTACGGDEQDYTSSAAPNSNGHNGVEVIYELEGGTYQNTQRHVRMYYYIPDGGETLISPPGSNSKRELIRANYHLTGWFRTRTENSDGTVSYSDEWDFENDKLKSSDASLTLYCGWAPNVVHTFNICYYDEEGAVKSETSIQVQAGDTFKDPSNRADSRVGYTAKREKNEETGKYEIVYYQGKDESGNWVPWDPAFTHPGGETSTAVNVFVEYLEGDFTYVSTADEFIAAASAYARSGNGVYLTNDIDLEGRTTNGFRDNAGKFKSVFYGNGFTVKNIALGFNVNTVISDTHLVDKSLCISLFGNLEGAVIEDVTFENLTISVDVKNSRINGVYVAPLAVLTDGTSSVSKVHISGSITAERISLSSSGVFEYENEHLFWQEGATDGADCSVEMSFTDNREA